MRNQVGKGADVGLCICKHRPLAGLPLGCCACVCGTLSRQGPTCMLAAASCPLKIRWVHPVRVHAWIRCQQGGGRCQGGGPRQGTQGCVQAQGRRQARCVPASMLSSAVAFWVPA